MKLSHLLPGVATALACVCALAACSPALDWREYRFEEGGFTILFPQKPGRAERKLATPAGEVTMKMVSARFEDTVFGAASADFGAPPDASALAAMHAALLKNLDGTLVSDRPASAGVLAGREVVKRGGFGGGSANGAGQAVEAELRARFFVSGKRYYQIAVIGRRGAVAEADLDLFFSSFKPD